MSDTDRADEKQTDTEAMPTNSPDADPTDRPTTADDQPAPTDAQPTASDASVADPPATDGGETAGASATSSAESKGSNRNVVRYVNYAVLGGLCLLAFIAALQFYLSTSQAINTWVTREYRSLFQAAFNLVIVLLAGTGIAFQLRRLYGE